MDSISSREYLLGAASSTIVEPTGIAARMEGSSDADTGSDEFGWFRAWLEGVVDVRRKVRVPFMVRAGRDLHGQLS
ncbi:hypothetical protein RRF57_009455 [Xylaria bambusicola]|uniref:Uncharacterized protein n=1 Tax=Xylaria bambusicola TaxID=326684 RepID=A0AAN7ZBZ2_9PEZI